MKTWIEDIMILVGIFGLALCCVFAFRYGAVFLLQEKYLLAGLLLVPVFILFGAAGVSMAKLDSSIEDLKYELWKIEREEQRERDKVQKEIRDLLRRN
jgi:hypothetical protein